MTYPQVIETFRSLQPGDEVELTHDVRVGFKSWSTSVAGTVVRTERRRHSLHFDRSRDDKVYSDSIVLKRSDGELTTVTLDEFSHLRVVRRAGETAASRA